MKTLPVTATSETSKRRTETTFQVEEETFYNTEQDIQSQVMKILDYLDSEDDIGDGSDSQKYDHGLSSLNLPVVKTETGENEEEAESYEIEVKFEDCAEISQTIESGKERTTLKEISKNTPAVTDDVVEEVCITENGKEEDSASSGVEKQENWSDRDSDFSEEVGNDDAVAEPKNEECINNKQFSLSVSGDKVKKRSNLKGRRKKQAFLQRSSQWDKELSCHQCDKVFKSRRALTAHKKTHSIGHYCEKCEKLFSCPSKLLYHLKIVHVEKHYMCEVCGAAYKQMGHLKEHVLRAHDKKTYLCEECGKSFAHPSNLRKHFRIHAAIKSFICDTCGKGFTFSGTLHRHMKTHTDIKPFECVTCGKKFRRSSQLSIHMRVHTMEKPFKCRLCSQAFNHNVSLKKHMRKYHL
jgi:uncharacterized Zn-finger protein